MDNLYLHGTQCMHSPIVGANEIFEMEVFWAFFFAYYFQGEKNGLFHGGFYVYIYIYTFRPLSLGF